MGKGEVCHFQNAPQWEGECRPFLHPAAWNVDVVTANLNHAGEGSTCTPRRGQRSKSQRESRSLGDLTDRSPRASPGPAISWLIRDKEEPILSHCSFASLVFTVEPGSYITQLAYRRESPFLSWFSKPSSGSSVPGHSLTYRSRKSRTN